MPLAHTKSMPCISNSERIAVHQFFPVSYWLAQEQGSFCWANIYDMQYLSFRFYSYAPADKGSKSESCPQTQVPDFENRAIILSFSPETRSKYTVEFRHCSDRNSPLTGILAKKTLRPLSILEFTYDPESHVH